MGIKLAGPIALLFPGQGVQKPGMGKNLYDRYPAARRVFERAEQVLEMPVRKLCFDGPVEELNRTDVIQPCVMTVCWAAYEVWRESYGLENVSVTAGHSPGEIITFRSPDGIRRMQDADAPPPEKNGDQVFWHSAALFISDNVATQIDGLAHITAGSDDHWYNGFKESDWGGDWGPRKCDAATIPPIVARGVLIDISALEMVDSFIGRMLGNIAAIIRPK